MTNITTFPVLCFRLPENSIQKSYTSYQCLVNQSQLYHTHFFYHSIYIYSTDTNDLLCVCVCVFSTLWFYQILFYAFSNLIPMSFDHCLFIL